MHVLCCTDHPLQSQWSGVEPFLWTTKISMDCFICRCTWYCARDGAIGRWIRILIYCDPFSSRRNTFVFLHFFFNGNHQTGRMEMVVVWESPWGVQRANMIWGCHEANINLCSGENRILNFDQDHFIR